MVVSPVEVLDISDRATATQLWEVQRAAYAIEADLIGFGGIPPLHESLDELISKPLHWHGIRDGSGAVVAALGFTEDEGVIDIDRLFVSPGSFRNGNARALLSALALDRQITVSTARDNQPATRLYESLGFVRTREQEIVAGLIIVHFKREAA